MSAEDINVSRNGFVVTVELDRPPSNYFDADLLSGLADVLHELSADPQCRAVVLAASGRHFCAGADFSGRSGGSVANTAQEIYRQAVRLFEAEVAIVAAVQGAAVGGGLGLACVADFRVATPQSRFLANFSRLGFHQGFGLTVTLPAIVGQQKALEMLYTSARVDGTQALHIGLVDRLFPADELRSGAQAFAAEIASAAPLAVASIRRTMRGGLAERVRAVVAHELEEQDRLSLTADWAEGVRASLERRDPEFRGS